MMRSLLVEGEANLEEGMSAKTEGEEGVSCEEDSWVGAAGECRLGLGMKDVEGRWGREAPNRGEAAFSII